MSKPKHGNDEPAIIGDVLVERVAVNKKGGSLGAILKRSLREKLSEEAKWFGAKIDFKSGVSGVFVAPSQREGGERSGRFRRFRVVRLARGFLINLTDEKDEQVADPTTVSVLSVFGELLKTKKLSLNTPEESDRVSEELRGAGEKLEAALKAKRGPRP